MGQVRSRHFPLVALALALSLLAGWMLGGQCAPDSRNRVEVETGKKKIGELTLRIEKREPAEKAFAIRDAQLLGRQVAVRKKLETRNAAVLVAEKKLEPLETGLRELRSERETDGKFIFKTGGEADLVRRLNLLLGECGECPRAALPHSAGQD